MIKTTAYIAAAAFIVAAALWLAGNPGQVTLSGGDWQIGVPLPVFALGVLVVSILVALVYRLWHSVRRAPASTRAFFKGRDRDKGYKALAQGMVAVAAGDAQEAARQAKRAVSFLAEPPLTMLLSAQAAQLNGDETAAKRYFTAMLETEEMAFLGLRGLLMQAQRDGHDTEALVLARRAHTLQPKAPWVLTTLLDLQVAERQWREAIDTVDQAAKRKSIEPDKAQRMKATLMLGCSQQAEAAGDSDDALGFARKAHAQLQDFLPASIQVATLYAEAGKKRAAIKAIEEAWAKTPHPALAALYVKLDKLSDPVKIVQRVEKLAGANRDHPESHIALTEALLDAKIWGAARSHLDSARGENLSARVCRLMATLEEDEHGDMASVRAWLLRATFADPDPSWICSECGSPVDSWVPTCSRCNALGSLDWKVPARAAARDSREPGLMLPSEVGDGMDNPLPVLTPANTMSLAVQSPVPSSPSSPLPMPAPVTTIEVPVDADASFEPAPEDPPAGRGPNP